MTAALVVLAPMSAVAAVNTFTQFAPRTGWLPMANPTGIAVAPDGTVYVCDTGNNRVMRLTSDGTSLGVWGSFGSGDGQFDAPRGVAVDASGTVFVADSGNDRIQSFSATGSFVASMGSAGAGNGQFNNPCGVAVAPDGHLWIADTGNHRIQSITSTGTWILSAGSGPGNLANQFSGPQGIAVSSNYEVYVADTQNDRIQRLDSTGAFMSRWGATGAGDGQFDTPTGVSVSWSGVVYVADSVNNRIQFFVRDPAYGTFAGRWGRNGQPFVWLDNPTGVAVSPFDGSVFVTDTNNDRVQHYTFVGLDFGTWPEFWGVDVGHFWQPSAAAVATNGVVYVADTLNDRVQSFNASGTLIATWNGGLAGPEGIAVGPDGNVYVVDTQNDRIRSFTPTGTLLNTWGATGAGDGQFNNPTSMTFCPDGTVFVADTGNNRIQHVNLYPVSGLRFFMGRIGSLGAGNGQFNAPRGISVNASYTVYVADTNNSRVQYFHGDGAYLGQWDTTGTPSGIAVGKDGSVWISNPTSDCVQSFTATGTPLRTYGQLGWGNDEFRDPMGISIAPDGSVWVADTMNHRIMASEPVAMLTLVATPKSVVYGSSTLLKGVLSNARGVSVAGSIVSIEILTPAGWVAVTGKTAMVSATGAFSISVKPAANSTYRAVFAGSTTMAAGASASAPVGVKAKIGTPVIPTTARAGRTFTLTGSLLPSHTGTCTIEVFSGTRLVKRFIGTTGGGRYSARIKMSRGTYKFRCTHVDAKFEFSVSSFRLFTLR